MLGISLLFSFATVASFAVDAGFVFQKTTATDYSVAVVSDG